MSVPAQIGQASYVNYQANTPVTTVATHRNYLGSGGLTMNHAVTSLYAAGPVVTQGPVTGTANYTNAAVSPLTGVANYSGPPASPVTALATYNYNVNA